jgi:tellurite resistance protein
LKVKKQRLQKDVDALFRSADDLADKAEKSHSVTCITKSNSLRRSGKEKVSEIQELEQQLDAKLLEMKNIK